MRQWLHNSYGMAVLLYLGVSVFCLISLTSAQQGDSSSSIECYVCSYVFAGNDGQTDIECVNDFQNFTKKSTAICQRACSIRAVYETGFTRLRSLARGCEFVFDEDGCDDEGNVRPVCQKTCYTPLCNDENGDLKPRNGGDQVTAVSTLSAVLFMHLLLLRFSLF